VTGRRISPNTGDADNYPEGCSGTPECRCLSNYWWRSRNRWLSWYSRPSACNDRSPRPRAWLYRLSAVLRDNRSFRRARSSVSFQLAGAESWEVRYLQCSHPRRASPDALCRVHRFEGNMLMTPDTRPKSWRRRQASHSTRAAEHQRQRAHCYARPGCC
jgi:hypothetical protein